MLQTIKQYFFALLISYMLGLANSWRSEEKTTEEVLKGVEWRWQKIQTYPRKNTLYLDIELINYSQSLLPKKNR